jgi:hypothetical protein
MLALAGSQPASPESSVTAVGELVRRRSGGSLAGPAITIAVSLVLLALSTVLGTFHTVMQTTRLDLRQWLICTAVAPSIRPARRFRAGHQAKQMPILPAMLLARVLPERL